ncbi:MAG: hypothetical protein DRG33_07885 [Deltaproteobacteria bacterium]|nr:MAG: hypothetical protein DRG33_07885 [Deltaproteobacteria bacterium]
MKRMSLIIAFLLIVSSVVFAHNGALSLYLDDTLAKCSANIGPFGTVDLQLLYVKDQGPYLGNAAEFRILKSNGNKAVFNNVAWSTQIVATLGDISTGITVTGADCLGLNSDVTYIGTITVMDISDTDTFVVRVVEDPTALVPGIYITKCEEGNPKANVLGGWLVFNGSCNPAVESKSWGAIKSIYK